MSQTGKLMHNLDQKCTKILNLTVLERMDPYIEEILITAAHVTFYEFNVDLNQWQIMDQKTWLWKKRYAKMSINANSESENEAELVTTFSAENVHYITSKRFGSMQTTTTAGSDEPLKLALAMALLRSKLVNKTSETSHPPSDTSSSEALIWKRKIEKLNLVIKELVKEKDEEKERFNRIIAGLLAEKEKDKVNKYAMLDRMSQIEVMLTATVRR
ncbi:uncharacterized protein LOC110885626 isoform X1 [Helianthus annuus]|uniref:uncharacterized protein LOC110885626 isoform X1 n=2 Tax=Helianthus annuus TaxID=4232 RepID=UPI000B8F7079|nr:uncharacterized protein LOC110885626 isoform X1 [Helianthus annuus]